MRKSIIPSFYFANKFHQYKNTIIKYDVQKNRFYQE
ncbi:hypothetical protein HNR32_002227 [Pectinatus brassicae]|uniref:Uncharacterized protein n=1 Tax=Pectinatus brassicae TaxID=862415 RepID=A0A840ULL1_9FIRM|nr:hypothetical protein [Pectinatus brassicae]